MIDNQKITLKFDSKKHGLFYTIAGYSRRKLIIKINFVIKRYDGLKCFYVDV